jgi:hypothetical protein
MESSKRIHVIIINSNIYNIMMEDYIIIDFSFFADVIHIIISQIHIVCHMTDVDIWISFFFIFPPNTWTTFLHFLNHIEIIIIIL